MDYERRVERKNFIFAFTVTLILLCAIMVVTVMAVQPTMPQQPNASSAAEQYVYHPVASDTLTVAVFFEEDKSLKDVLLLRFNPEYGQIPLTVLPANTMLHYNGEQTTLEALYPREIPKNIKEALSDELNIAIDRYACISQKTFLQLAKQTGSVRFKLPYDIVYTRGEYSVNLPMGDRRLDGQDMLNLFGYPDFAGDPEEKSKILGSLFSEMINQNLDLLGNSKSENFFKLFVNNANTDITYVDYEPRRQAANFVSELTATIAGEIPASGTVLEDGALFAPSDEYRTLLRQYFQNLS